MSKEINNTVLPIEKIKTNPSNPRTIKDEKFEKLVLSIKQFPQMLDIRPIVVNEDMVVLGGNMRLAACKKAGLKKIPVIIAKDLTEEQQREFIIKDNVGFGEWDWEILLHTWDTEQLDDWGLDIPNFEPEQVLEAVEDDFEVPEGGIETDIVIGDLFEIGEHRLLCGDSTQTDTFEKLMGGGAC
jgi:ParB-like chromosome segregation protein Spo0J